MTAYAFSQIRRLPLVKKKIDKELAGAKKEIIETIHKDDSDRVFISELPVKAISSDSVLDLASKYEMYGKFAIDEGRVSGAVYTDRSPQHIELLTKIYSKYAYSNPLHPDVFPGARKMEAETIRMVYKFIGFTLLVGSDNSATRVLQLGVETPVIVCARTAHAAFDKAAFLCGMRVRHVDVDNNNRVDIKLMEKAIDSDVCMLVASAPNFPSGTVDPVPEVAKYGCTPKGSSVVMYRSKELLHYQYFSVPEWTGGIYATPTICGWLEKETLLTQFCSVLYIGSRAGANSAAAWATLLSFGRNEYRKRCEAIISNARKIAAGIETINGLEAS
ncbi:hypothetical protein NECAME_00438 [Necator americanus]|uniref:Aminotransferase class V domain-containing protein n=1 Tax=Necator americanus TaxID=51031 RepID=W2T4V1_NECAM|nr:hypothetical protein NECAME_00438 [Necator americanus]ETN76913.1 hypothetical protein NECAME_00438 [Necator americanus]